MEPVSIIALSLSVISGLVMFIKGIKKCKCSKQGVMVERDIEKDALSNQQEFTLKLIELMKTYDEKKNIMEELKKKSAEVNEEAHKEERKREEMERIEKEIKKHMDDMMMIIQKDTNQSEKKKVEKAVSLSIDEPNESKLEIKRPKKDKKITQFIAKNNNISKHSNI